VFVNVPNFAVLNRAEPCRAIFVFFCELHVQNQMPQVFPLAVKVTLLLKKAATNPSQGWSHFELSSIKQALLLQGFEV